MEITKRIYKAIVESNNVALFCHMKPDCDTIGAACAMKFCLENLGKKADIFCDCIVPEIYNFIPGVNSINKPQLKSYDTAISLDCSDLKRLGKYEKLFKSIDMTIKIDHHKTDEKFAKLNYTKIISSTCELLYNFFVDNSLKINREMAFCLYTGLATDTGCFMHNNTTKDTHFVASKLLEYDIDIDMIHSILFKRKTQSQLLLLNKCLSHLTFEIDNKISFMYLTIEDFKLCKAEQSDTVGFVNLISNVDGCKIGIILSEEEKNVFAISFRTNGSVDVSEIAKKFGGGGHSMASGAKLRGSISSVKKKILDVCKDFV